MANNTTNNVPSKSNKLTILAISGWGLIYTAVMLGTGFYLGSQFQAKAQAQIDQAVKAATSPAPKS